MIITSNAMVAELLEIHKQNIHLTIDGGREKEKLKFLRNILV